MRILLFTIFFHASLSTLLYAQPGIEWQRCLGGSENDQAACIQLTHDGGYIVAGYSLSNNGDAFGNHGHFDFWVIKMSLTGTIQWKKMLGGSDDDRAYSICQSADGGFLVAGFTQSNNGDVTGNHGNRDAWVVKLNGLGNLEWEEALGGSGWDEFSSVQQAADGGYILAGRSNSNNGDVSGNHAGSLDFWVVKVTGIGDVEWQRSLGGSEEDIAVSAKQTADGGYIIAGEAKSTDGDVIGNNGDVDFWTIKLDHSGGIVWQNALGGIGLDGASDIFETSTGFIACGYESSNITGDITEHMGLFDCWVVKLNETGELIWQKTLGGSQGDWGRSILQTSDGMYVLAGMTQSSDGDVLMNKGIEAGWILKLNELGEILWQKSLGGTIGEGANCIRQSSEGGYVVAGYAWSNDGDVSGNHGEGDLWIVKLAPEASLTTSPSIFPLEIYPNPATSAIALQIPTALSNNSGTVSPLSMVIYDLLGQVIHQQTIHNEELIDIKDMANGLYYLQALTPSGKIFSGKFLKDE